MTSMNYPSYKDRDRIIILEKQVEDLKMLTMQQNLTIKKLQEESIAKSDKISAMMGAADMSRDFHGNLTMTRQLRSLGPANYRAKPPPKSNLGNLLKT